MLEERRIELRTFRMQSGRSTTELHPHVLFDTSQIKFKNLYLSTSTVFYILVLKTLCAVQRTTEHNKFYVQEVSGHSVELPTTKTMTPEAKRKSTRNTSF